MAQNSQLLKRRIKTSKNIAQIARALEMIAASKIKKAQDASGNNKPYVERITTLTMRMSKSVDTKKIDHPYLKTTDKKKKLLIVISPDRGLCGSLNTNLYKKMIELDNPDTKVVTVGKKVGFFASKLSFELLSSYPMGSTLPDYSMVFQLKTIIDEELEKGNVGTVSILFADFISFFTQTPTVTQLLPLSINTTEEEEEKKITGDESIYEPDKQTLLEELLPYYLETQIYNSLLLAFTSEQAAQMIAMQNAKNNAFDIAEYLSLVYNKSRQERITNEILDLSNSIQI